MRIPLTQSEPDDKMFEINSEGTIIRSKHNNTRFKKKNTGFRELEYAGIGYSILIPILLGLGLGLVLDNWLATKPVFTIILILVGVVGSFYNMLQLGRKQLK